jgi:hypothetical protein
MITKQRREVSEDRRIQKTKQLLAKALKDLVNEKGYDAVTVQDIIERANVGRSTFYSHYESKEQLLLYNTNFQNELVETNGKDCLYGVNLVYLFNHLQENISIVKKICGRKIGQQLSNHFIEIIASKIIEHHKRKISQTNYDSMMLRYKAQAAGAAIIRILFCWLLEGTPASSHDVIKLAENTLKLHFELDGKVEGLVVLS